MGGMEEEFREGEVGQDDLSPGPSPKRRGEEEGEIPCLHNHLNFFEQVDFGDGLGGVGGDAEGFYFAGGKVGGD